MHHAYCQLCLSGFGLGGLFPALPQPGSWEQEAAAGYAGVAPVPPWSTCQGKNHRGTRKSKKKIHSCSLLGFLSLLLQHSCVCTALDDTQSCLRWQQDDKSMVQGSVPGRAARSTTLVHQFQKTSIFHRISKCMIQPTHQSCWATALMLKQIMPSIFCVPCLLRDA